MEKCIKGDKSYFAIERDISKVDPYLMGYMCLWIGGISVGTYDDEVMLHCVQSSLSGFIERLNQTENPMFSGLKKEKIFHLIYKGKIDNAPYLMHICESFDDFHLYAFKEGHFINFIWKLVDKPFFKYPDYPKGILHKRVEIDYLAKIIQDEELWKP